MYANGRNIWRITPDTNTGVSKKNFLVKADSNEVVFYNKGQTITFPKGNIIKDGDISAVGTCGYWVETPADVKPIVVNDADRYAKYPAFYEVFDNYETGAAFDYRILKNSHTWESWIRDGGSATIEASKTNANDKVLTIKGNAFLSNIKAPQYITAGDNYAKQQVWELSFMMDTLPTGEAELKMLNATSGSGVNTDGGFRVYDGKLYYGKVGEYTAFENVTLAAGTEYKLKRVLDFRTSDAMTSSYYIYDANGNLLDKVENVAIENLKLPVQKLGISTENYGSGVVHFDDYKLYATGVTTDLEIYDAATGMLAEDFTAARSKDTAYRFSWMNGSGNTVFYNVVATYSDGTKEVLKSIEMAPGSDNVETGVVKVSDGKSVTIALEEVESKTPVDDPEGSGDNNQAGTDNGNNNGNNNGGLLSDANGDNTVLVLLLTSITVAVACGCAIALTLVLTAKKKAPVKKAPTQAEESEEADESAETDTEAE